jgi:hypothetical protein
MRWCRLEHDEHITNHHSTECIGVGRSKCIVIVIVVIH